MTRRERENLLRNRLGDAIEALVRAKANIEGAAKLKRGPKRVWLCVLGVHLNGYRQQLSDELDALDKGRAPF